jgi:transcriptional regulator with XRE-family HTH domain
MSHGETPIVQQRRLRADLKRAREGAGQTQKEVADALDWSSSKVIRIETGAVSISTTDLIALLHHYGITDKRRVDELVELARSSRRQAWWDKYRDTYDQPFLTLLGYEASTLRLRQYQALLIPGLLQIRDYSRAVMEAFSPNPDSVARGIEVRQDRQRLLEQKPGPELFFVLDEAVIRRQVGGPQVMRQQLLRLEELDRRPNINIQVLPFSAGAHVGMKGSFTIFEFPEEEGEYAVLLEHAQRDTWVPNNPDETSSYVETFFELEAMATPKEQFGPILHKALDELSDKAANEDKAS